MIDATLAEPPGSPELLSCVSPGPNCSVWSSGKVAAGYCCRTLNVQIASSG